MNLNRRSCRTPIPKKRGVITTTTCNKSRSCSHRNVAESNLASEQKARNSVRHHRFLWERALVAQSAALLQRIVRFESERAVVDGRTDVKRKIEEKTRLQVYFDELVSVLCLRLPVEWDAYIGCKNNIFVASILFTVCFVINQGLTSINKYRPGRNIAEP